MQAHLFGARENSSRERGLHQHFPAGDGQSAIEGAKRRREVAEPLDHLLGRNVGAVLQMPGIGIVAVGATKRQPRKEQYHAQAGAVVARRRLIGMDVAEGPFLVAQVGFVRRVGRKSDAQIVPAAGFEGAEL